MGPDWSLCSRLGFARWVSVPTKYSQSKTCTTFRVTGKKKQTGKVHKANNPRHRPPTRYIQHGTLTPDSDRTTRGQNHKRDTTRKQGKQYNSRQPAYGYAYHGK